MQVHIIADWSESMCTVGENITWNAALPVPLQLSPLIYADCGITVVRLVPYSDVFAANLREYTTRRLLQASWQRQEIIFAGGIAIPLICNAKIFNVVWLLHDYIITHQACCIQSPHKSTAMEAAVVKLESRGFVWRKINGCYRSTPSRKYSHCSKWSEINCSTWSI